MSERNKQVVNKVIRNEKVKVLLYPVAFFALIYGMWISVQPSILRNYDVYNLISNLVEPYQIGGLFIGLATIILMSYWVVINRKDIEIVVTGYASQEAAKLDYTIPLIQTRSYTFGEYDKTFIHDNPIFKCAYMILKTHEDFKSAEDVFESEQPTE